jgi:multiple sugar transport system permease protein
MTGVTKLRKSVSLYAVVTFFALFSAMPFFWMLITSFKRAHDLFTVTNNPFLYNDPPTLETRCLSV